MERSYMGEQMSLQPQNEVLKVPTAVNFSDHLIENKNAMNRCKGVIQVLSNKQQEVFRKTLSLANVIAIFWVIGEALLWPRLQGSQLCSDATDAHLASFNRGKLWNEQLSAGVSKSIFPNTVLKLSLESKCLKINRSANLGDLLFAWSTNLLYHMFESVPYNLLGHVVCMSAN